MRSWVAAMSIVVAACGSDTSDASGGAMSVCAAGQATGCRCADGALPDRHSRTPLDWARLKGYEELVLLLRQDKRPKPDALLTEIGD